MGSVNDLVRQLNVINVYKDALRYLGENQRNKQETSHINIHQMRTKVVPIAKLNRNSKFRIKNSYDVNITCASPAHTHTHTG